ncbi:MAG: hypothetical protein NC344_10230 [Bacteroidales bacterium]|nr:hypothetical protein [Bacteroidales bacterium]MCM1148181.1 hypothetical protein [Bacteroidales bacterium]MCM1207092.1 hypothetical protein [Bacillota bacterium]MCM1510836.1 hypothetical protein [Clostridium sp.]
MRLLFVKQLIDGDVVICKYWLMAIAMMGISIIVASVVDLRYGRMASKAAGVYKTTSYGLRKTIYKLKDYLTFLTFGAMIDGCASFFFDAPFCSAVVTIGVILIEGISVREKITAIDKGHDPLMAAKAFINAYGLTDAEKIEKIIKTIQQQKEAKDGKG